MHLQFHPGQRWISSTEPNLGLGIVLETTSRQVTIAFFAAQEERTYAIDNAPLSRAVFRVGETLKDDKQQSFIVEKVQHLEQLLVYHGSYSATAGGSGGKIACLETKLDPKIMLNSALDRLLSAQLDPPRAFELRYHSLKQIARLGQSPVRGLLGIRANLLAHQFYIAQTVSSRICPRVLLADEVGLGKTIQAGSILHRQLICHNLRRALIIVPETLLNQWLVELMRRFNLQPVIFNQNRLGDALSAEENPFLDEQIILISNEFLLQSQLLQQQAVNGKWDMLIVDEAHHLNAHGRDNQLYQKVAAIANNCPSVLLLTATPLQLGVGGHFARLALLDPQRFSDLDQFQRQQQQYIELTPVIEKLLDNQDIDAQQYAKICQLYQDAPALEQLNAASSKHSARQALIDNLIDLHGTSRLLFRNTRRHIKGFPKRNLIAYGVADYNQKLSQLIAWLKSHRHKVLIIVNCKQMAGELEQRLQLYEGILAAAFHEDMSLVARDRAASWFAEEDGARVLICSEIGSEGRNFQFARHLVMLDLPANPALLEQRIGRLDRIGQADEIFIHLYYQQQSREELLFLWYRDALDAFASGSSCQLLVQEHFQNQLQQILDGDFEQQSLLAIEKLGQQGKVYRQQLEQQLLEAEDKLLELSSFNKPQGEQIVAQIESESCVPELEQYLHLIADNFGFDIGELGANSFSIKPNSRYLGGFNSLEKDGISATCQRQIAVQNEDLQFITWEHPLVLDAFDQVICSSLGNASIGILHQSDFPAGTLLLESLLVIDNLAAKSLQLERYLPHKLYRIVVDSELNYLRNELPFSATCGQLATLERSKCRAVVEKHGAILEKMSAKSQAIAARVLPQAIKNAAASIEQQLGLELARLVHLQTVNPNVRDEEIKLLAQQLEMSKQALTDTKMRLDALRVIICL